jgi:hypothetical protein
MEERIGENVEKDILGPEKTSENSGEDYKISKIEKKEPNKENILSEIYSQRSPKDDKNSTAKPEEDDKKIDSLLKESVFGKGIEKVVNGIKKTKCFIGEMAHNLDGLHDKYVNKNNKNDKQD